MSGLSSVISASQARNNFYTLIRDVDDKLRRFTITLRGKAKAVMLHPDEVAAWQETMEILADKKLVAQILKSESERKAGRVISEKKLLKELKITPEDLK